MSQFDADRNPVEVLAEEFASRVRNGETPSVQHYADQHPDLAEEINELFPAIAMMETLGNREHAERKLEKSQAVFAATPIEQLGDFRIIRQIGRGGMGVVYEAEQESLGRRVAVKVLGSNAVSSPRQLQRFQREAHSAASLHHTNIVPIFGVGQHDDVHYYVMQLIEGVGLDQIIHELNEVASDPHTHFSSARTSSPAESGGSTASAVAAAAQALRNGKLVAAGRSSSSASSWSPSAATNIPGGGLPVASTPGANAETLTLPDPPRSDDVTADMDAMSPTSGGDREEAIQHGKKKQPKGAAAVSEILAIAIGKALREWVYN